MTTAGFLVIPPPGKENVAGIFSGCGSWSEGNMTGSVWTSNAVMALSQLDDRTFLACVQPSL
jgi:hypothetical protein